MTGKDDGVIDPSRWDEVGPLVGGYPLRPYEELREDPYGALPGFYAGERNARIILAFQPGWDGVDGGDAVHWKAESGPTVAQVREAIASLLISSWLVQDRDDAPLFRLGDEPGSIESPWGVIPARVVFARRPGDDAPWENLNEVLAARA